MNNSPYVTELEAATFLALSPKTLSRWRWAGKGPSYKKLGSSVRYAPEDLEAFANRGRVER